MNQNRKRVEIPSDCRLRCLQFGERMVAHYAASPASCARSGNRGTERNAQRQAQGKIGECALALYLKLGIDAVKFDPSRPDDGSDVILLNGVRADVKTTPPPYRLIWSNSINDLYSQKNFDVLVAVSNSPDLATCWIEGWITKARFYVCKRVADGSCGLEPGTWFVDKDTLSNIDDLPFLYRHYHAAMMAGAS